MVILGEGAFLMTSVRLGLARGESPPSLSWSRKLEAVVPYTLHPTPYTLHPKYISRPYTLHPAPLTQSKRE